jgi:cholesterol transport system auxiliary component
VRFPSSVPSFPRLKVVRSAPLLALALMLTGCGSSSSTVTTFDLTAARPALKSGGRGTVIVVEPTALLPFDSDRLIARTREGTLSFIAGAQWADRLPKLVQARIIQTFENANRFRSVGRPGDRLTGSVVLNADIRAFEVREDTREAVVEISVKLIGDQSGQIAAGRLFSARAPVISIDGPGASVALDQALNQVLAQITAYTR